MELKASVLDNDPLTMELKASVLDSDHTTMELKASVLDSDPLTMELEASILDSDHTTMELKASAGQRSYNNGTESICTGQRLYNNGTESICSGQRSAQQCKPLQPTLFAGKPTNPLYSQVNTINPLYSQVNPINPLYSQVNTISPLYSQLTCKKFKMTYTSLKPNVGEFALSEKKKKIRVIDLPGYERQREIYFEEHKSSARGIVFVLDSATLQKEIKEVAGYLYTILSDRVISSNAPPLLILCNKQDLTFSKGANVIRSQLEKEMTTLRITRSAALKGVGDTANNNAFLGKRDKDFDFADVKPIKVEFVECSVLTPDMQQLYAWLNKVV
ncbi:hypothetical protein Btru_018166 [Bulinus truncatus]|nr:hypothetical protein Btru_018166 [Bulinus truncatus]